VLEPAQSVYQLFTVNICILNSSWSGPALTWREHLL